MLAWVIHSIDQNAKMPDPQLLNKFSDPGTVREVDANGNDVRVTALCREKPSSALSSGTAGDAPGGP
ncbi:hypothetical protein thsrh120_63630 [Rhizobium sp. No.120]